MRYGHTRLLLKILNARQALAISAAFAFASPAYSQITLDPSPDNISGNQVCTIGHNLVVADTEDGCTVGGQDVSTITFNSGSELETLAGSTANLGGAVNFNSNNVQFNSANVAFGNSTVVFNGGSVSFNNSITTNGITNTGAISTTGALSAGSANVTGALSAGSVSVGAGGLTIAAGANVSMGGNQVHNVAAGTANTDAVNVGQLNAATSGIVTDVTALETLTATHTTQIAAQATQITALQAADLAFDSRIDTLELLAEDLDERIGDVDDRASAGTAAAVALSGAMFLPGKSFNLTGNVGTYRGAHAAAVQFGALVSNNVALNAGFAKGFNKGGKTALRAGFTIGW
jgi:autotransporter adhesin